jgi:nucleotide-binding universal stress UspA family protein
VFRHILIPLDGSKRAESAIPAGMALAKALGATITLLHILEKNPPEEVHGQAHLQSPDEAQKYLKNVRASLMPAGIDVHTHVHLEGSKHVASSIAGHEEEFSHDFIVMCTHGRGGASQLLFGSIAQQVIAAGTKPLLLIPVRNGDAVERLPVSSILLPLDGRAGHEQAVQPAAEIASACGAILHLFMVVPTRRSLRGKWTSTAKLLPSATSHFLDMSVESGKEYLLGKKRALEAGNLRVHVDIVRGVPSEKIVKYAQSKQMGLIALGTHGRKGMDAFFSVSVVNRIVTAYHGPLLLVP